MSLYLLVTRLREVEVIEQNESEEHNRITSRPPPADDPEGLNELPPVLREPWATELPEMDAVTPEEEATFAALIRESEANAATPTQAPVFTKQEVKPDPTRHFPLMLVAFSGDLAHEGDILTVWPDFEVKLDLSAPPHDRETMTMPEDKKELILELLDKIETWSNGYAPSHNDEPFVEMLLPAHHLLLTHRNGSDAPPELLKFRSLLEELMAELTERVMNKLGTTNK